MYGPLNPPPQPSPLLLATPSRFPNYHLYKFKTPFPRYVCSGPQGLNVQQKDLIFVFKDNNYSNGLLYPSHPLISPLLLPQTAASCSRYVFQCGGGGRGQRQLQLLALCGPRRNNTQLKEASGYSVCPQFGSRTGNRLS